MDPFSKSSISPLPEFFDRYILKVPEENLPEALQHTLDDFNNLDWPLIESMGDKVYQPGKWTLREIIQHINDNERIQTYRALCIARGETVSLPGYDEDNYALNSRANTRSWNELREEFLLLRKSAINLFRSFDAGTLQRHGTCSGIEISVLALGFILPGHQLHHIGVIRERYLPLAGG